MMTLLSLPDDIILHILSFMPLNEVPLLMEIHDRLYTMVQLYVRMTGQLNLEKSYLMDYKNVKNFLMKCGLAHKISKLSIDGVTYQPLTALITNCTNLVSLHMMDIILSYHCLKRILEFCTKLEDIAFVYPKFSKKAKFPEKAHCYFDAATCDKTLSNLKRVKVVIHHIGNMHFFGHTPNVQSITIFASAEKGKWDEDDLDSEPECCHRSRKRPYITAYDWPILNYLHEVTVMAENNNTKQWLDDYIVLPEKSNLSTVIFNGLQNKGYHDIGTLSSHEITKKCKVLRYYMPVRTYYLFNKFSNIVGDDIFYTNLREAVVPLYFVNVIPLSDANSTVKLPELKSFHCFDRLPSEIFVKIAESYPDLEKLSLSCGPFCDDSRSMFNSIVAIRKLTSLTHLHVPPCILFDRYVVRNGYNEPLLYLFSRPSLSKLPGFQPNFASFSMVLKHCLHLMTLEIMCDLDRYNQSYYYDYHDVKGNEKTSHVEALGNFSPGAHCLQNISNLQYLRRLTLCDIPIRNGDFFQPIVDGCRNLEFLRIKDLGVINYYKSALCKAIPLMQNLAHFRIDQKYLLPLGDLLSALSQCPKLQRIFLKSDSNREHALNSEHLIKFLLNNSRMRFAWFAFGDVTETQMKMIRKKVKKDKPPHLYLQILRRDYKLSELGYIPVRHVREMVNFNPWIIDD